MWEIVDKHAVHRLLHRPDAIRTFMRWGDEWPEKYKLDTLRLLGSVGEPINPEAWMWYRRTIGRERCPIVDTWWQTETGSILITPLPGLTPTMPGSATAPFFGVDAAVVDEQGRELPANHGGYLVIRKPWPSMLRGIWGDPERYRQNYWSPFPGRLLHRRRRAPRREGLLLDLGRVDDVINVSGHRLSTMEIESASSAHDKVCEAAVVGRPDEMTGQAICAFVTIGSAHKPSDLLRQELLEHVSREIGKLARPAEIRFTDALPKTRSGKIMRRLLRDVAAGVESVQDTSTIEDYSLLAKLRNFEE
jgi:acetyl-CoA synthetase